MRNIAITAVLAVASAALGADGAALDRTFRDTVHPFVQTYCISCHSGEKPKGDLDLSPFNSADAVAKDPLRWELVLDRLREGDMPPKKAEAHPKPEQRKGVIEWVVAHRAFEAERNAGDPGVVLARRLSNAEYDYTIRDLTGVDIRPAKDFPIDPANPSGFDNTGESLTMSPALLKKYLEAARAVADHAVLTPDGLAFAPHPAVTDTDRDKYCVNRIVAFYKRQKTDYADYFAAAWRFKHRATLGKPEATLADIAAETGISGKYLATVWEVLSEGEEPVGPIAALRAMWSEIPANASPTAVREGCERMRGLVVGLRPRVVPQVKNLTAPRINNGAQALVLWKNRTMAANRRKYAGNATEIKLFPVAPESEAAALLKPPAGKEELARYEASFARFCSAFPDAFYVSERARVFVDPEKEKKDGNVGRLLSAGFHSQGGFFRDDGPLCDMVLDDGQRLELDRLWQELDFVADAPKRQHFGLLWFERTDSQFLRDAEFDRWRPENKDSTSDENVRKVAAAYVNKARRTGASDVAIKAMEDHFTTINAAIRWVEQARLAAEPSHVKALQDLAQRAYRRPLSLDERDGIAAFYRSLRNSDSLPHEDAIRDTIVAVLMSPHFAYRVDLPGRGGGIIRALDDHALASRLSYFLWASMPDKELLDRAAAGDLHKPDVLKAQSRRMLRDSRARGFVTEFAGNWLDFRRFEEHNAVDRERFKSFDNDLRQAMFEEPIRFFLHVAAEDKPILDFLYADYTFVNHPLAKHYGLAEPATSAWMKVDNVSKDGRGGLLPMAVFLTKNAPGLRTSPVKRGYWVARRLLGERIPPPPPNVPELPADEAKLGELSLRATLERHRADPNCASCHAKFDSLGLVFENYGPIGERRTLDLAGHPVDTRADFPSNGGEGSGLDGLRAYLRDHRQDDFLDNLSRKLLSYALGRSLLLSDEPTIRQMRENLSKENYRFSALIETIVTSPQFLNKRADSGPGAQ